jgi:hypothetical protein
MIKCYVKLYEWTDEHVLLVSLYCANSKEEALKLFKMMCNHIIDRFADSSKEPKVDLFIDGDDIHTVQADIRYGSTLYIVNIE